jgi:DNA-binding MarR family transcriptional regulator
MVEDPAAQDIREIKWHQEAIDSSMELLIKAHGEQIEKEIMEFFGGSKRRAEIYLECDGKNSVTTIANKLQMKQPNVSTEVTKLKEEGLIKIKKTTDEGYIYQKTKVDKILRISKKLKEKFGIAE